MKPSQSVLLIQKIVAEFFDISLEDLQSRKKSAEYSHPRMLAMYLTYSLINMNYAQVAKRFDRDHTTVIYAVRWVMKRPRMDVHVEALRKIIRERFHAEKDNGGKTSGDGTGNQTPEGPDSPLY